MDGARARSISYGAGNRVYEDVQPQYRWLPTDKEDTLVVDLTGFKNEAEFKKEHLRIQIDNYGNLKVSGERPLGGVRWSRFQRVLHLPEDCDASGIRATFDDGILLVVMPKLVRDVQAPPPTPAPQVLTAATVQPPAAAPTPPPAKESAKGAASSSALRQQSKFPAAPVPAAGSAATPVAVPPTSSMRRPAADDRRSRGNTVPNQKKEEQAQLGAPPADDDEHRRKAEAADKKETEPAPPPVVPAKKAPSDPQVGKTAGVDQEEKETAGGLSSECTGTAGPGVLLGQQHVGTTQRGRRPKQLLANVMVALVVLVGLGLYFVYRYKLGRQDGQQEQPAPVSIKED